MQQILAYETDLLDYGDIFDGSREIAAKVEEIKAEVRAELDGIEAMGGAIAAIETGYMKEALVASNTERLKAIEAGEQTVVGVNAFTETEPSPLAGAEGGVLTVPEMVEAEAIEALRQWRAARDETAVAAALEALREAAQEGRNIMEPSIAAAKAGVTTGEWGATLREVFGEYRAPTGITAVAMVAGVEARTAELREGVDRVSERLGERLKLLVGKPGLDGHSNGAEQIAVRAREIGMAVVYDGIRLTPEEIVAAARREGAHVIGLSILSGSHVTLVQDVMSRLRGEGLDVPVVVGGIIPADDVLVLRQCGVKAVYTPKDFALNRIMDEIIALADRECTAAA